MPRFFLHVRTEAGLITDPEGSDLLDLDAAKSEALTALRELLADRLRSGRPLAFAPEIEIADEAGHPLATIWLQNTLKGLH